MSPIHRFCHEAMATEFEVVIADPAVTAAKARQAAAAVFAEVDRLELELSRFKPSSEVWRISLLKAGQSTALDFASWDCLSLAKAVHAETGGAFDVTLGPLMKMWRNSDGTPRIPFEGEVEAVQHRLGMDKFTLDPDGLRITVHASDIIFDLGAVGKGYALDQALRVLEEEEITCALINAGESTIVGIGAPPEESGWPVELHLEEPQMIHLTGDALSCSGFAVQGNHIMDPRTLRPIEVKARRSYVQAPTAAMSDALSTAFMVMSTEEVAAFCQRHPQITAWS
jgi:thiamine biosynthesis lipoprotein